MKNKFVLFLLAILAHMSMSHAVDLAKIERPQLVGQGIEFFEDADNSLSIVDIHLAKKKLNWETYQNSTLNFGYSDSTYWLRFPVYNSSDTELERILEIGYPILDYIEFYLIVDRSIRTTHLTGDWFPYRQRPIPHRNFLFELDLGPKEAGEVIIKVRSGSSVQIPMYLSAERQFHIADEKETFTHAMYFGMMLVMVLFNMLVLISLKEIVYLYYMLFISSFAGTMLCLDGIPNQYMFHDYPQMQDILLLLCISGNMIFASLFARKFLDLSENAKVFDKIFQASALVASINAFFIFIFDYKTSMIISVSLTLPISFTLMLVGPFLWHQGFTAARYYTLAWLSITVGAIIYVFNKFGIMPRNFLTENAMMLGSAIEALLLSVALADRLNRERSDRIRAEEKVAFNALHNTATSLPNKAYLENWINTQLTDEENANQVYMVLVHLRQLHAINKTIGHLMGQELLDDICQRVNQFATNKSGFYPLEQSDSDICHVALIDANSLALVTKAASNQQLHNIATQLLEDCVTLVEFKGMMLDIGAAIGIASYTASEKQGWIMVRNAQIAIDMCEQKGQRYIVYSELINPYNERRLALAGDLSYAIENKGLELYFQPKVSTKNNNIYGTEALVRWQHPEYGNVSPAEFIPIAEQTGLINRLTEWVINEALERLYQLAKAGHELSVAINLSAINLKQKHFVRLVDEALKRHAVPPQQLCMEITESAMMDDPKQAMKTLNALNELGVRLSIDDFGTGYSSLSYIKKLPVQEIKVDRSFVMELLTRKHDRIIVRTTINMCHDLGYEVVAEGVETIALAEKLKDMGCDYLQGYYFAKPLPFHQLSAWLDTHQTDVFAVVAEEQKAVSG